jgi:hypothetical protein
MTFNRGKKPSKKKLILQKTLKLIQSLQKLEEAGALHINHDTREVHLIRSMFWDGKADYWKLNFCRNCHMLMERHEEKKSTLPIHFYDIDLDKKERGDYLTSFLPEFGVFKEILEN